MRNWIKFQTKTGLCKIATSEQMILNVLSMQINLSLCLVGYSLEVMVEKTHPNAQNKCLNQMCFVDFPNCPNSKLNSQIVAWQSPAQEPKFLRLLILLKCHCYKSLLYWSACYKLIKYINDSYPPWCLRSIIFNDVMASDGKTNISLVSSQVQHLGLFKW